MNELTYMNYIEESERKSFIEEKMLNDEFEKLNLLYEMTLLQEKIHNIDVENKVLTENGSYDDYAILLMEANEQIQQEREGILAKIFDWFSKIFESLHKAITGIFSKKVDPNAQCSVKQGLVSPEFSQLLDGIIADAKGVLVQIGGAALTQFLASLMRDGIDAVLGKTLSGAKTTFNKIMSNPTVVNVKKSVLDGITNKTNSAIGAINNLVNKLIGVLTKNKPDKANENFVVKFLRSLGDKLTGVLQKATSEIDQSVANAANSNQPQSGIDQVKAAQNAQNNNNVNTTTTTNTNNNTNTGTTNPTNNQPNTGGNGTGPVNSSADVPEITDGDLSMYESIFGQVEEEKKDDDISDLLAMI